MSIKLCIVRRPPSQAQHGKKNRPSFFELRHRSSLCTQTIAQVQESKQDADNCRDRALHRLISCWEGRHFSRLTRYGFLGSRRVLDAGNGLGVGQPGWAQFWAQAQNPQKTAEV